MHFNSQCDILDSQSEKRGENMSKIDSLTIKLVTDEEIEKLEQIKKLLTEIKQLKEDIFGKQETN